MACRASPAPCRLHVLQLDEKIEDRNDSQPADRSRAWGICWPIEECSHRLQRFSLRSRKVSPAAATLVIRPIRFTRRIVIFLFCIGFLASGSSLGSVQAIPAVLPWCSAAARPVCGSS